MVQICKSEASSSSLTLQQNRISALSRGGDSSLHFHTRCGFCFEQLLPLQRIALHRRPPSLIISGSSLQPLISANVLSAAMKMQQTHTVALAIQLEVSCRRSGPMPATLRQTRLIKSG